MGMDFSAHVGIFLSVPPVQKEVIDIKRRCSKGCSGAVPDSANFCANCGAPVAAYSANRGRPATEVQALSPYELPKAFKNMFSTSEYASGLAKNHAIWFPDDRKWGRHVDVEHGETCVLSSINSDELVAQFKETFQDLLAYIEQACGAPPTVCWGVVAYAS